MLIVYINKLIRSYIVYYRHSHLKFEAASLHVLATRLQKRHCIPVLVWLQAGSNNSSFKANSVVVSQMPTKLTVRFHCKRFKFSPTFSVNLDFQALCTCFVCTHTSCKETATIECMCILEISQLTPLCGACFAHPN